MFRIWAHRKPSIYFLLLNEYNIFLSLYLLLFFAVDVVVVVVIVVVVAIVSINIDAFFRLQLIWNCVKFLVSCHIFNIFLMSYSKKKWRRERRKKTNQLPHWLGNILYWTIWIEKKGEISKWLHTNN